MPEGAELRTGTIHGIPLYDADQEEATGIPEPVAKLKEDIVAADGLLLATPEYNNSVPGVFKNAIDWLSRPSADIKRVFGSKPVAIVGASPGGFGTVLGQNAWLPVLRTLGTEPWFGGRLLVSLAQNAFDEAGLIPNDATKEQLQRFLQGFVEFIKTKTR
jgi:NAD(P)H-dependent FMN reductase